MTGTNSSDDVERTTGEPADVDDFEDVETTGTAQFSGSYKVLGELEDATDAAGVVGRNTAGSGSTYGVFGETESVESGAAGTVGATSGSNIGVEGRAYDNLSNLGSMAASESAGVLGRSDKFNGYGVLGWSNNHIGILGRSDDANNAGVFGYNSAGGDAVYSNGDAFVEGTLETTGNGTVGGNLDVSGSESVSNVGAEVYLGSAQSIPSGRTRTKVEFDSVVQDDFSNWDGSNYWYTIPEDGTYHVTANASFLTLPNSTYIELWLSVNGTDRVKVNARGTDALTGSKTLFGLSAGDNITVDVAQNDSASHGLNYGRQLVYLTVAKMG